MSKRRPIPIELGWLKELTPAEAKALLAKGGLNVQGTTKNRIRSSRKYQEYIRDMRNNRWTTMNGQTIALNMSDQVVDGNHRLRAQVEAARTLDWVFFRVSPDAHQSIDNCAARTLLQSRIFMGKNPPYHRAILSGAVLLHQLESAHLYQAEHGPLMLSRSGARFPPKHESMSWGELDEYTDEHETALVAAAQATDSVYRSPLLKNAELRLKHQVLLVAHHALQRADVDDCAEFFEVLKTGVGHEHEMACPIAKLRDLLYKGAALRYKPTHLQLALLFTTWNRWRAGHRMSAMGASIRLRMGPSKAQAYPFPK